KKASKPAKKAAAKKPAKKAAAKKPAAALAPKPAMLIAPYLTFNGNCEEVFNFYRSVFGGNFTMIMRFKDTPPSEEHPVLESEANRIMHVSLPIGNGTVALMGSDSSAAYGDVKAGDNFAISINATSKEEADRVFNGLSEGGKVTMPMGNTFWGSYFGMWVDKYGINWMMSYDAPRN
ncbi:MAG TPA: VOC family protein, partial [Flavobacteriales bacterium]|nr:VOC family protein [Flavobacteriales bacterium]